MSFNPLKVRQNYDGYVAFFTGDGIAGDNDMFWDRLNNMLGLGTNTPAYKLDVSAYPDGASDFAFAANFWNQYNSFNGYGIKIQAGNSAPANNGACRWIYFYDNSTTARSYIGFSTASPYAAFYAASDARLKSNILDTKVDGLSILKDITLRSFDWKPITITDRGKTKIIQKPHQKNRSYSSRD